MKGEDGRRYLRKELRDNKQVNKTSALVFCLSIEFTLQGMHLLRSTEYALRAFERVHARYVRPSAPVVAGMMQQPATAVTPSTAASITAADYIAGRCLL